MWLGGDAWSSFAGGEGLCEAEMLKVCPVWPLGLVEVPAGTKGPERAERDSSHYCFYILQFCVRVPLKSSVRLCCLEV